MGPSSSSPHYILINIQAPGKAPVFGFQHPKDCNRMEWGNGGSFKKVVTTPTTRYEVEHVLEWQLVTGFFEWMSNEYHSNQDKFDNPQAQNAGAPKVTFCEYWKGTWEDTKAFTIPGKPIARVPLNFVRKEYPSKINEFNNEFVWLEKELNAPAKAQVSLLRCQHLYAITDPTPT